MPDRTSRVLVLDPDFEHDGGHNYVTNQILLGRLGSSMRIVCPITLPASVAVQGAELCRAFPRNSYVLEDSRSAVERCVAKLRMESPAGERQTAMLNMFAAIIADQLADMNAS